MFNNGLWLIEYQVRVFWYQVYQAQLWERMLNRSASLAMSTSVLKALPGKLDIKRHSPSILYLRPCRLVRFAKVSTFVCVSGLVTWSDLLKVLNCIWLIAPSTSTLYHLPKVKIPEKALLFITLNSSHQIVWMCTNTRVSNSVSVPRRNW